MCAFPPLVSCKKTRQAPNVKFTVSNISQRQTLHGYYQDTTFAITNTPLYATKENAFTGKKLS